MKKHKILLWIPIVGIFYPLFYYNRVQNFIWDDIYSEPYRSYRPYTRYKIMMYNLMYHVIISVFLIGLTGIFK